MSPYRRSTAGLVLAVAVLAASQLPAALRTDAATAGPRSSGPPEPSRSVTLLTGDRITVHGANQTHWTVQPGKGREKITFSGTRVGGHLRIVPNDAVAPLRAGRLDDRLFDVTTLLDSGYDDKRGDLPLIVSYAEDATGQAARSAAPTAGARVVRALPGRGLYAVRAERRDAGKFWRSLTTGPRTLAATGGVRKVWLDGIRRPELATSVRQIGATAAWQAGYTGAGVTVAVLDTGVDADHPDLAGRIDATRNFTEGFEDDRDLLGHGTHVASTVGGSGAASGGRNRGVAPDTRLVSGKVCTVGFCAESWILAGMQWAAAEQQAKIVNLSLGVSDTAGTDPLEQAVNDLSARYGTLFVASAGNRGPEQSVGSPASAAAALAVGAVDRDDQLTDFSSRGPEVGDAAVKPELTAPGTDIVAARGSDGRFGTPGDDYVALSGTSMAAPHVTGAAALLAQQHPDWSGEQLKATLMAAAHPVPGTDVFGQGAGRVNVVPALTQSVTASPASVAFGLEAWPHDDDQPVTKTVTYHNSGAQPLDLDLAIRATGPTGQPAPAGMFTLGTTTLTVPAGGSAQTVVTADTGLDTPDGNYGGYLVATAGELVVHTPFSVGREHERFDLTLVFTGRDGAPATDIPAEVYRIDAETEYIPVPADGRLRLPRGTYVVGGWIYGTDGETTHLVRPRLELTRNETVHLDARLGKPLTVTVPDPSAGSLRASLITAVPTAEGDGAELAFLTFGFSSFNRIYSAQIGPAEAQDGVWAKISNQWAGEVDDYHLTWYERGRIPTGFTRHVRPGDLATVHASYASSAPDLQGVKRVIAAAPDLPEGGFYDRTSFPLPAKRTNHYLADSNLTWENGFSEETDAGAVTSTWAVSRYEAGHTYRETWNRGVRGPAFVTYDNPDGEPKGATRTGDEIHTFLSLYSDAPERFALSEAAQYTASLYRDGQLIGEASGWESTFHVPAEEAGYRLRLEARRGEPAALATQTSVEWSFRSAASPGRTTALPLSVVRFAPQLDETNAALAGATIRIPVTVYRQPDAAAASLRTLTVDVSYDDGQSWQKAHLSRTPTGGVLTLHHPPTTGYVSLRATATDSAGNTVDQTLIHAYELTAP
ncbi:S8 family serine peptidase [Actinomycetes bacterium KLBMP 9797]